MKKIIILGANADIGFNITKMYLKNNFQVIGTYRKENNNTSKLRKFKNLMLIKLDILKKKQINNFIEIIGKKDFFWDEVFCSIGTSEPIGNFFETDFDIWEKSLNLNFVNQLRVLHGLFKMRNKSSVTNINFMAGGGTNSAFKFYSAYCISKIALIKMCELIDAEDPKIKIQILGPGFVKTKTHLETIKAGNRAGNNYKRVKEFLEKDQIETKFEKIFEFLQWVNKTNKNTTSGRNFSLENDQWNSKELIKKLNEDPDMYKLRRHKNFD